MVVFSYWERVVVVVGLQQIKPFEESTFYPPLCNESLAEVGHEPRTSQGQPSVLHSPPHLELILSSVLMPAE